MGKSIKELIAEATRLARQAEAEAENTSAAHRDMAAYLGVDPATQHFASLECYENGCKTCRIPPMSAKSPAAVTGQQFATQNAQAMLSAQAQAQANANAQQALGAAWLPNIVASPLVPSNQWWMLNEPTSAGTFKISFGTGSASTPAAPVTASDSRGSAARASTHDAIAGCRLGCGCKQHSPAKPAPWVPSVDDFDLLPDA